MCNGGALLVAGNDGSVMLVCGCPAGSVIGMLTSGIGEFDGNGSLSFLEQWSVDACKDTIAGGHTGCSYLYFLACCGVVRLDGAIPQHQFLTDVADVFQ